MVSRGNLFTMTRGRRQFYRGRTMASVPPPSLSVEELLRRWSPRRIGRRVSVLSETTSTNSVALEHASEADADGLVIVADYQTGGRGRLGRSWHAPRGASLLLSALLTQELPEPEDPGGHVSPAGRLTLLAAVAACEAIRAATEITPAIRWPNDLRIGGRKLGGILVESRQAPEGGRAWVIGIGINCLQHAGHFPAELRDTATSLEIAASHPIDRASLGRELIQALDRWLSDSSRCVAETIRHAWQSFAEPIGQSVRLRREGIEFHGHLLDIDPYGGLIVQCDDGRREWFDPMLTTIL